MLALSRKWRVIDPSPRHGKTRLMVSIPLHDFAPRGHLSSKGCLIRRCLRRRAWLGHITWAFTVRCNPSASTIGRRSSIPKSWEYNLKSTYIRTEYSTRTSRSNSQRREQERFASTTKWWSCSCSPLPNAPANKLPLPFLSSVYFIGRSYLDNSSTRGIWQTYRIRGQRCHIYDSSCLGSTYNDLDCCLFCEVISIIHIISFLLM